MSQKQMYADQLQGEIVRENPFTPTFGEVPPHMAGRSLLLADMRRAFSSKRRHPNLTTAITGARGSGKTALMSLAADEAEQRGWVTARTVAMPGMLDDILIAARRAASHIAPQGAKAKLAGIEVAQVLGVEWEREGELTNWRSQMTDLLEQLDETGTGLLISVDEVAPRLDEMIQLAAVYQLFVTEGRKVALLMAGLPHNMLVLEKDKTVSFLRRAQKCQLGRVADADVADAMRRTVKDAGRQISDEALEVAVRASEGFPFMMQLVGFRMWDCHEQADEITAEDAERGSELAKAELRDRIVATTYSSLSAGDKAFLAAMAAMVAEGGEPTSPAIAARLGKTPSYATQYKNRLFGQGVIEEAGDGRLRFQLPLMAEYVAELDG